MLSGCFCSTFFWSKFAPIEHARASSSISLYKSSLKIKKLIQKRNKNKKQKTKKQKNKKTKKQKTKNKGNFSLFH
jgi:hypothetical protein